MSVQITPGRELEIEPQRGTLPMSATLLFFASAPDGPETVDVIYRIVETDGQPARVGFEHSEPEPGGGGSGGGGLVLRKRGLTIDALPQAVSELAHLVDTGGATPPLLIMIQASIVDPEAQDDSDYLDRTAAVVKMVAPAGGAGA